MTVFWLLCGLGLLLAGGTALVTGASGVATRLGISPLVVGLTVLAFGTSSPELVVNIIGAIRGETELAFGNVTGSNLANLGLVLGLAALIKPVAIRGSVVRRELPLLLLATTVLLVMMLDRLLLGQVAILDRSEGLILLLLFTVFIYITVRDLLAENEDPLLDNVRSMEGSLADSPGMALQPGLAYIVAGILGLTLGGHLTVVHGSELAVALGISPVIVGMLVVGVGTSLPELVTSVIAAVRGECDLCVGNVVGSNIFNSVFVLPVAALIHPLPIPAGGQIDVLMALVAAALIILVFYYDKARMDRMTGLSFVLAFAGYMAWRALA